MAIRPNQRRVTIIMDKDDYDKVSRAAKSDRRSVSSYCNNVIMCTVDRPHSFSKSSIKCASSAPSSLKSTTRVKASCGKIKKRYKVTRHPF